MTQLTFAIIEAVPQVIQLVVGVLGLSYALKGRPRGVSGQMVGAFVVLVILTVLGLIWQFVSTDVSDWGGGHLTANELNSIFLGVDLPLGILSALAWLLVALAVLRTGRQPQQFGAGGYGGPANYPMAPQQQGFGQPGYAQPGAQQPGYPQTGAQQPGYPQTGAQQTGYPQTGYPQPGYNQPGYPQPNPGLPPQAAARPNQGLRTGGTLRSRCRAARRSPA